jgi:hypothetical protein
MLGNNGNQLAEIMHNEGILKNGMTLDQCADEAKKEIATTPQQHRWLNNDSFWEDFSYRADELGYKLNY